MRRSSQSSVIPEGYEAFLRDLKTRIRAAQVKAALSVNREMVMLYWEIGATILEKQNRKGWGARIIDQLSKDLRHAFPEMKGFSVRNLQYMRAFAATYTHVAMVQQLAAQIPWFHNCTLLDKVKDPAKRQWYIEQTIENGWSRNVLVHQIETDLYARQVEAPKTTNFAETLPPPQSDLARQVLKDPYIFDFLSLGQEAHERDLERSLLDRIKDFLLEQPIGVSEYRLTHTLPGDLAQALPAPGDLERLMQEEGSESNGG